MGKYSKGVSMAVKKKQPKKPVNYRDTPEYKEKFNEMYKVIVQDILSGKQV